MTRAFIIPLFFSTCIVFADAGDELVVQGGIVNLRAGPSLDHDVVAKLEDGRKLYEIQRQDVWVQVRTEPTEGSTGWIHSSLVRKSNIVRSAGHVKEPDKEEKLKLTFEKFKPAFDTLNARIEIETGNVPFTNVDYAGNGAIRITASETWLNSSRENRERHLAEIFKLWDSVVDVGLPVSVDIVNSENERFMVMFR